MRIHVLTLFPEIINAFAGWSIVGRAINNELIDIEAVDIRNYSKNKHKQVDDYPFGGGPGMVMKVQPVHDAIEDVRSKNSKTIYLSPQGKPYNQEMAKELSQEEHLILLCGHYEGIDNRVIDNYIDMEVSIGDYVLTGGEIPAMAVIESIIRLLPGVLGNEESFLSESHYKGLLEYPQYTRPREYKGLGVPDVLLSGDHEKIRAWKKYKSLEATYKKRPDLLEGKDLTGKEKEILKEIKKNKDKERS